MTTTRLKRCDLLVAWALLTFVLATGWVRMVPGVIGVIQDDGVYAITARSLAEGTGYRLINLPGEPRQTKYPILFPAVLSVIWKLSPQFPANAVLMQWLTLGSAASAIALGYLFLVAFDVASRPVAAASCLLCALVPMFLYLSTLPMSEAFFSLLVVLALWRGQSSLSGAPHRSRWSRLGTGVVIALPFLCRGFGVAILAGVLIAHWRASRPLWWVVLGCAVVVGPWTFWAWPGLGQSAAVTGYYTDYADSMVATFSAHGPRIIGLNLVFILTGTLGLALDGLRLMSGPAAVLVVVLFLVSGVVSWWRIAQAAWRGHLLATCLGLYCAIAVVWPWPPARFLLPVLPLLGAFSVTQLASMFPWRGPGTLAAARVLGTVIVAVGVFGQLGALRDVAAVSHRAGYPEAAVGGIAAPDRPDAEPADWRSYSELFAWIRAHSEPSDVVACGLDTVMFLYTDRKSFRPAVYRPETRYGVNVSPVGSPAEVQGLLERGGARYLALVPGFSERQALAVAVAEIQKQSPGFLELVYTGRDARFTVLRVGTD